MIHPPLFDSDVSTENTILSRLFQSRKDFNLLLSRRDVKIRSVNQPFLRIDSRLYENEFGADMNNVSYEGFCLCRMESLETAYRYRFTPESGEVLNQFVMTDLLPTRFPSGHI